jgi:thioredoxin-like negative regulator of GroEL
VRQRLGRLACFLLLTWFAQPCLAGDSLRVQPLSLTQFNEILEQKSQCTLFAFLAAWCAPCIEELPDLVDINKRYQSSGLKVIGISMDFDGPRAIVPLLIDKKVDFPVYWVDKDVSQSYGITGIPLILMVRGGKVIDQIKGKRNKNFLNHTVEAFVEDCLPAEAEMDEVQLVD